MFKQELNQPLNVPGQTHPVFNVSTMITGIKKLPLDLDLCTGTIMEKKNLEFHLKKMIQPRV